MQDLRQLGRPIDEKDLRIIRNLYWSQITAMKMDGELSERVDIQHGVRQGCAMSPDLFSIVRKCSMRCQR